MNEKTSKNPKGAGRTPGVKIGPIKPPTVFFSRRVTPQEKELLEKYLQEIRNKKASEEANLLNGADSGIVLDCSR